MTIIDALYNSLKRYNRLAYTLTPELNRKYVKVALPALCIAISACAANLPIQSNDSRHIFREELPESIGLTESIPDLAMTSIPISDMGYSERELDRFSLVVNNVDLRELLFALARDSGLNFDVSQNVTGTVSMTVSDQTIFQILERLARQASIRWRRESNVIVIENDTPVIRSYEIDYVNVSRDANTQLSVSTSIVNVGGTQSQSGGSSGINNSTAALTQISVNNLWQSLESNLRAILGDTNSTETESQNVFINRESGLVTVIATEQQHSEVLQLINSIMQRALAQVLIEATVVEVTLSDEYQAGVDWTTLGRDSGRIGLVQSVTGLNISDTPSTLLTIDRQDTPDAISATVSLLSKFGELKVLSSPKIMALNNQAAILRVVDNRVYFTIEVEPGSPATATSAGTQPTYTSQVQTVPTGFVMSVTPQISNEQTVTLNVRPTISRVVRFVNDPNPLLAASGVTNAIPEIQIREIESILKVDSGQIAVLGGLMQDSLEASVDGTPLLSRLPGLGSLFSYTRENLKKTELIVFIRPVVVGSATSQARVTNYRNYLPGRNTSLESQARQQIQARPDSSLAGDE